VAFQIGNYNYLFRGGYAISVGVYLIAKESDKESTLTLTYEEDYKILNHIVEKGCVDGLLGKPLMYVDGFEYEDVHQKIIKKIIEIVKE
jgi:hypothetical protein